MDTDTVQKNMDLHAKWVEAPAKNNSYLLLFMLLILPPYCF